MKKYIVILLLTISSSAYSQISIGEENTREVITIQTDTMSVKDSFTLLDKLCAGNMWLFDRKVIYKGQTYFKFGVTFNKRKNTYLIDGYKMKLVQI
jgi:hypothetical protein